MCTHAASSSSFQNRPEHTCEFHFECFLGVISDLPNEIEYTHLDLLSHIQKKGFPYHNVSDRQHYSFNIHWSPWDKHHVPEFKHNWSAPMSEKPRRLIGSSTDCVCVCVRQRKHLKSSLRQWSAIWFRDECSGLHCGRNWSGPGSPFTVPRPLLRLPNLATQAPQNPSRQLVAVGAGLDSHQWMIGVRELPALLGSFMGPASPITSMKYRYLLICVSISG